MGIHRTRSTDTFLGHHHGDVHPNATKSAPASLSENDSQRHAQTCHMRTSESTNKINPTQNPAAGRVRAKRFNHVFQRPAIAHKTQQRLPTRPLQRSHAYRNRCSAFLELIDGFLMRWTVIILTIECIFLNRSVQRSCKTQRWGSTASFKCETPPRADSK
jgi:hypothetical protein